MEQLSQFIKELRNKKQLTQKQLAELVGPPVTQGMINKWENGVVLPNYKNTQLLSQALGFKSTLEFFGALEHSTKSSDVIEGQISIFDNKNNS